jgi:hypothetical protein
MLLQPIKARKLPSWKSDFNVLTGEMYMSWLLCSEKKIPVPSEEFLLCLSWFGFMDLSSIANSSNGASFWDGQRAPSWDGSALCLGTEVEQSSHGMNVTYFKNGGEELSPKQFLPLQLPWLILYQKQRTMPWSDVKSLQQEETGCLGWCPTVKQRSRTR